MAVIVGAVYKFSIAGTLFNTFLKCTTSKNYTFLIAFKAPAISVMFFFNVALTAFRQKLIA
jgi:hypothetical protein